MTASRSRRFPDGVVEFTRSDGEVRRFKAEIVTHDCDPKKVKRYDRLYGPTDCDCGATQGADGQWRRIVDL